MATRDKAAVTESEQCRQRIALLRSALSLAMPKHYAGECLICDDGEPCPTLAFIAEVEALLAESESWQNAQPAEQWCASSWLGTLLAVLGLARLRCRHCGREITGLNGPCPGGKEE